MSQKSLNLPQSVTADLSDPLVSVELAALTPAQAIKLIQELAESALPGMLPNYYLKKLRAIAMLARIAEKMPEGQG